LTLQGATAPADLLGGVFDLREGVVPGVAVVAVAAAVASGRPVLPVGPDRAARKDGATTGEHQIVVPPPAEPAAVAEAAVAEAAVAEAAAADPADGVTEVVRMRPRHRVESGAQPVPGSPAAARAALRAGMARAEEREKAEREKAGQPGSRGPERAAPGAAPARPPDSAPAPSPAPRPEPGPVRKEEAPKAEGYLCAQGHLNDPRVHVCGQCGIPMSESTGGLVVDERPPLGVLVFDDGTTHTVDAGYLLGREPEGDARVRSGVLRPIVLDDRSGAMSRVHAEIRLENWDVVLTDSGSSNGSFVAGPGARAWTTLTAGKSFRLVPGTRVQLGQRNFTFETVAGVR
jgi:hypothetical protein